MLTELTIDNLKCFGEKTTIPLAPLTLIYGENSGGKSTVLLALRLLRRQLFPTTSDESTDTLPFGNAVASGDASRKITLGVGTGKESVSCTLAAPASSGGIRVESLDFGPTGMFRYDEFFGENTQDESHASDERWRFERDERGLVAAVKPLDWIYPISNSLAPNPLARVHRALQDGAAILRGVERLVERDILEEWCHANPEAGNELKDVIDEELEGDTKAKVLHAKWRLGAPDWLISCPRGYQKFRTGVSFTARMNELRATKYRTLIECASSPEPSRAFADMEVRLRLADGDPSSARCEELDSALVQALSGAQGCELMFNEEEGSAWSGLWGKPGTSSERARNLTNDITKAVESVFRDRGSAIILELGRLVLIPPLRKRAERMYSLGLDSGNSLGMIEARTPQILAADDGILAQVNAWLLRLGMAYKVQIARPEGKTFQGYFQVLLQDTCNPNLPPVNYADVGFGVSQILPILVAGLSGQNKIILVEQPELHIHPRLQAELGSFFAESIRERGHQFMIETHSEHLMLRVMKHMRQTFNSNLSDGFLPLQPRDVGVLYVERSQAGSVVREMPLNARGELVKAWPGGFFEEGLREVL